MPTRDEGAKPANILPNPSPAGRAQLLPPVKPARSVRQTIEALEAIEIKGESARADTPKPGATFRTEFTDSRPPKTAGTGYFEAGVLVTAGAGRANWLKYAAAAVLALGFGWGASAYFVSSQSPATGGKQTAAIPQATPMELLRQDIARMNSEIIALRSRMESANTTGANTVQVAELRSLRKNIAEMASRFEAARVDQTKANAEINGRIERLRVEDNKRQAVFVERISRLEKRASDPMPVGSIPATSVPKFTPPKAAPAHSVQTPANLPDLPSKQAAGEVPQRLRMPQHGYVLREVYRGMALVEGRNGYREILPGDYLPGAGRIRSIERRSGKWVVVTSNGTIDSTPY